MINRLAQDVSNVTGIPRLTIDNIVEKINSCLGHCVYETIIKGETLTEVDIGIGILYIKFENDQVKYKFIPSEKLSNIVTFSILNKESPLILDAEKALKTRVEKTYKELI